MLAACQWVGGWVLLGKGEQFGAQAGGGVGDSQADQVGLPGVGKIGINFDRCVELLTRFIHRDEAFQRLDLGKQAQLSVFDLLRPQGKHVALGGKGTVRQHAAHVLDPDAGAVFCGVKVFGHLLDPDALDGAAISSRTFGSDAEPFGFLRFRHVFVAGGCRALCSGCIYGRPPLGGQQTFCLVGLPITLSRRCVGANV